MGQGKQVRFLCGLLRTAAFYRPEGSLKRPEALGSGIPSSTCLAQGGPALQQQGAKGEAKPGVVVMHA